LKLEQWEKNGHYNIVALRGAMSEMVVMHYLNLNMTTCVTIKELGTIGEHTPKNQQFHSSVLAAEM
jgi:hypothetical protein